MRVCVVCVVCVGRGGGKFSMQRFRLFFTNRHGAYEALPLLACLAADACFVAAIFSSALILAGKILGEGGGVRFVCLRFAALRLRSFFTNGLGAYEALPLLAAAFSAALMLPDCMRGGGG